MQAGCLRYIACSADILSAFLRFRASIRRTVETLVEHYVGMAAPLVGHAERDKPAFGRQECSAY